MTSRAIPALAAFLLAGTALAATLALGPRPTASGDDKAQSPAETQSLADTPHRSPIALAVSTSGDRLLSANQTSGSVSLVDIKNGRVLHELKTGDKPSSVALSRDGRRGVVTHWFGYDLAILEIKNDKLAIIGRLEVGPEPRGVAMTGDGSTAFVAVGVSNELVRVDLNSRKITGSLPVGREPRGVALSLDESHLVVGNCALSGCLARRRTEL